MRFTKGAYWDAEIKRAQEFGMRGFPVYTRKWATDCQYLATARRLLGHGAPVYPQFATHNALTVASIIEFARELAPADAMSSSDLHGMGDPLYDALLADGPEVRVRVYAPVGKFRDLLAYLVRRLLENGSNTSFVHQITDRRVPSESLVEDVYEQAKQLVSAADAPASALPSGARLFTDRRNSKGIDLQFAAELIRLTDAVAVAKPIDALPSVTADGTARHPVVNPAQLAQTVGSVAECDAAAAKQTIDRALAGRCGVGRDRPRCAGRHHRPRSRQLGGRTRRTRCADRPRGRAHDERRSPGGARSGRFLSLLRGAGPRADATAAAAGAGG